MISSYHEPATSPQQQLDLITGTHIDKMRRKQTIVRPGLNLWMKDPSGTTVVDAQP
jgi:hypothetical protein